MIVFKYSSITRHGVLISTRDGALISYMRERVYVRSNVLKSTRVVSDSWSPPHDGRYRAHASVCGLWGVVEAARLGTRRWSSSYGVAGHMVPGIASPCIVITENAYPWSTHGVRLGLKPQLDLNHARSHVRHSLETQADDERTNAGASVQRIWQIYCKMGGAVWPPRLNPTL